MSENESRAMPAYRSHKIVHALKIASIKYDGWEDPERETDGSAVMTSVEEGYAPIKLEAEYCRKHKPQVGGYYVVYADGYKSWSPAEAFESGYTRIEP